MRPCTVLRVFTVGDDGGNHLGVVSDVTGLDPAGMQQIASALGFPETIYLDWNVAAVPVARIFTPATELQFAGHPLVGAAWYLGTMAPGDLDHFQCGIGPVRFTVAGDEARVAIPAPAAARPAPEGAGIAADAGLPAPVAAWWVDVPQRYLMVDLGTEDAVAGAAPDLDVLRRVDGTYIYAGAGDRVKARFFAPALGVDEDPATGSAAAALAAVRVGGGAAAGQVTILQGAEIGAPSRLVVQWQPGEVRLGGSVRKDETRVLDD